MNDIQLKALKKTGLALLVAVCFITIMALSPKIGAVLLVLTAVGTASYFFFTEYETEKSRRADWDAKQKKLEEEREAALRKMNERVYSSNN